MDTKKRYCMGCLSPVEGDGKVCPICSHDNSIDNPRGTLPAGTVLAGKYLVGKVLSQNDLTIVYIGLDTSRGRRVCLEEFMPRSYADRSGDGVAIAAAGENQAQYKTLLSDIKERWKNVGSIENKGLLKLRELLTVNNTAVCVTPYIAYTTLEQYLEEQGPLDWTRVKGLFMPLLSLVSTLHNRGIIHYGISPENIVVDRKGTLRLMGFALPELRTVGKGLSPQLYDGYSAPEQYARNQWQGEWSDIYALGAILYRALSGSDPIPATQRVRSDALPPLSALHPEIPEYVSAAVAKAMSPDRKDRQPSIDLFTAALLEETGSNTTVFRSDPQTRPEPQKQQVLPFADGKHLLILGLAASLILNMVLGAGWLSAKPPEEESSSLPEEPVEPALVMEDFTGEYWPMLQERLEQYPTLTFQTEETFDEEVPKGVVLHQSIAPGSEYPAGSQVTLTLSQGPQFVLMPRVEGCTLSAAQSMLDSLGITWYEDIREDSSLSVPVGTVVCDTPPGSKVTAGYKVRLTIRTEPESSASSTPAEE